MLLIIDINLHTINDFEKQSMRIDFLCLLNTAAIAKSVRSSGDPTRPLLENFQIWTKPLNIAIVVRLL